VFTCTCWFEEQWKESDMASCGEEEEHSGIAAALHCKQAAVGK